MVPFGKKAKLFIVRPPAEDAFINILEGSVRSGKTWAMIPKLLSLCKYKVAGQRVIMGVSKQTVYNNILSDLFDFVGEKNYSFNRQTGELVLFGVKWIVIGAKDEGSEKYIRGLTVGIAYVDEATLCPESAFKMLVSRLSPDGARLYCTTNPDTPFHYLKADYLDSAEMRAAGDVWSEHFTLDDNLSLSEAKREQYRRMYKGVFYERFILGRWVIAEGAIFGSVWGDDLLFDDATAPVGLYGQGGYSERIIAIDYGTTNATCFLEILDDGKTLWVTREYYWDSAKELRQKTDAEYRKDLQDFIGPHTDAQVILDPSAASFKAECEANGIFVVAADNEVLDGIRMVSTMLGNRLIRFHRDCVNAIKQHQTYAWDAKAAKNGEEKPIKANDHAVDPVRYAVKTKISSWRLAA